MKINLQEKFLFTFLILMPFVPHVSAFTLALPKLAFKVFLLQVFFSFPLKFALSVSSLLLRLYAMF